MIGVSIDATINAMAGGSSHSPATNGDRSSTSCRYWVMNR